MPAITKATLLFDFTPVTELYNVGTPPRSGGWSESLWFSNALTPAQIQAWATKRALALATDCSIIGWRQTPYVYTGNKLIPGHAAVGILTVGGVITGYTNSPDDTLRLLTIAGALPVATTLMLRGVPDANITSGQFTHTGSGIDPFTYLCSMFSNQTGTFAGSQVMWLGRSPVPVAQRVLKVNGTTSQLTTQASVGVVASVDFVRLRRVYDDNGLPIKGTYLCTLVTANADGSFTYTLSGLPNQTRSTPSGTARQDIIGASPITSCSIRELASRKVGRPFFLFRGRRTKQRV